MLVLPVIRFWRRLTARHTKLYSWAALSLAMVAVILITSLGARPDVTQLLFLALVGVVAVLGYWRTRPSFAAYSFATNAALMVGGFLLAGMQVVGYVLFS